MARALEWHSRGRGFDSRRLQFFSVIDNDDSCSARNGNLLLPHGEVKTPVFMPVGTNATIKGVTEFDVREIDLKIILSNVYHLYLRPGISVIEKAGGLHSFMNWKKNILTDSGGYQIFSLAKLGKITDNGYEFQSHIDGSRHFLSPEDVVDIQWKLGVDIQMVLDECTAPGISEQDAVTALERTTLWANRSREKFVRLKNKNNADDLTCPRIFAIVQGNFFKHLRERSAEELIPLDFDGYAIGGLSVGEAADQYNEFVSYSARLLPRDKPVYLMGVGTPEYILNAVEAGVDMFDCVFPTRAARNGLIFSRNGKMNIRNEKFKLDTEPIDSECACYTCRHYSRSYLRHLNNISEISGIILLTIHNISFFNEFMGNIRQAIKKSRFLNFKKEFLGNYKK